MSNFQLESSKKFLKFLFFLLISFYTINIYPQDNNSTTGNGKLSGIVIDKDTRTPLEGVVLTLKSLKDSTAKTGATTDSKGLFLIESPYGEFKLTLEYIGYNPAFINHILLSSNKPEIKLDTLKLSSGLTTTEEIKVEDERSTIQFLPGKKIFDVGKDETNKNGSAIDVLKNVPSVTVDIDENISLRGSSGVKILIDGRPSGLNTSSRTTILEQIPANSIDRIELVTNPDAKYDAEGTSGIINIVLKKNTDFGMNGQVTLGAGTGDKYSSGLNLNSKNSKMNIFGNYNYRLFDNPITGSINRVNFIDNTTLFQTTNAMRRMNNHSVKGGIDYFPGVNSTLGFSVGYNDRDRKRGSSQLTTQYDLLNNLIYNIENKSEEDELGKSLDLDLTYVKKFKTPKQELSLELGYSRDSEDNNQLSKTYDYINPVVNIPVINDLANSVNNDVELSVDYAQPFKDKSQLDFGYKGTLRKNDNHSIYQNFDYTTNSFVENTLSSNQFNYKEFINAVYGTYSGSIKNFSYSLGLRAEQTSADGDLVTTNTQFKKNYFSLFPSFSLAQKFGLEQEAQLTYSRRISRPDLEDLNPFIERSDPLNLQQGNPYLNPQYIDSYELSFIKYFGQTVFTPSLFFRQTHDEITRYRTLLDSNVTLTSFANNSSSKTYGAELIFNTKLLNKIDLNGNVNYYKSQADASNIQPGFVNSTYSWSGRLSASSKIADLFSLQAAYNYSGKRATGQGIVSPFQTLDVALKKDFFNQAASLSLRVSDVFNQQKFTANLSNIDYNEILTRRRNSRAAFLTFTYNFGKQDKKFEKKKPKEDTTPPPDDLGN